MPDRLLEDFYLLHRTPAPTALEVQHAWLLYNAKDDRGLYPVLSRLDAREDLTAAQRKDVENLWASWAVRRAAAAMEAGNVLSGVEILQAASQNYPDNVSLRRAVASAYARVGRAAESLSLFKSIPMQEAGSGDFQGAIAAALAAKDMPQAEIWLRQALQRFPGDAQIMGLAARFEQARGNNQRASDFWRAALAAMPPGSTVQSLNSEPLYPAEAYRASAPGDIKRLLDPRYDTAPTAAKLPPLPSYGSESRIATASVPPGAVPAERSWTDASGANPLPAPPAINAPAQRNAPGNMPIYMPQSAGQGAQLSQPVLIEQSSTQDAVIHPVSSNPDAGLRITSQPMDSMAAQAQARFAEQTDGQLTEGSATVIHTLPNVLVRPLAGQSGVSSGAGQYNVAQYTPSAQEAATGAYSAPKQQNTTTPQLAPAPQLAPQQQQPVAPPVMKPSKAKPVTIPATKTRKKAARKAAATSLGAPPATENLPGSGVTPLGETQQQVEILAEAPAQQTAPATSGAGLTDQELEQRNLPPLRGPWVRVQREARATSPRDEAEMQLRSIESGYSAWLGGAGLLNYRSGSLGFDHLSALEAPFEASTPLGYHGRLTVVAKPVFLDSGQSDGTSVISVSEATTGGTKLVNIPQPIGTLTATDTTPPAQQNAVGIGGEMQLAFPHMALAGGYTPSGFLVATVTGRMLWKPGNGPFTFNFVRDPVKDTQLSYAGLRDPSGNTLGTLGQIWGGVVANQGNVQFARGDVQSGFYLGGGGQYLTGYMVQNNTRVDGSGGAYWRVLTSPENGNLSIGVNFFAMHYAHNEDAFTHGMGGYFSPQAYFLANVPFTWTGHVENRWHYNILGSMGVQAFQEDMTPLWPLAVDKALETAMNNPQLPAKTSVGSNYDLRGQVAYQISPHWFAGGFLSANNSRNYSSVSTGFYVRFLFRAQPSTATGPTGIFPTDGLRPFAVP